MERAMDRTSKSAIRRPVGRAILRVALGLAAISGCSHARGLRSAESPQVGSPATPAGDPYLDHHRPPPQASRAGAARNDTPELETGRDDPATGPPVVRSTIHPPATSPVLDRRDTPGIPPITLGPPIAADAEKSDRLPASTLAGSSAEAPLSRANGEVPTRGKPQQGEIDQVGVVVSKSRARVAAMSSYQVSVNRQERVGETLHPAEDILLSIRREPKAVRIEWPSGAHKGREVIYSSSDPSGMLHVNMADSIVPVPKLSFPPDSPMVMRTSRHPITEAGFDAVLDNLETNLRGDAAQSKITYRGIERPTTVGRPCHMLGRRTPAGEVWLVYIDAETWLPALVQATDSKGDLLERYCFRDVRPNVAELASAEAFDPDRRWAASSGLLGRFARSGGVDAHATATSRPR